MAKILKHRNVGKTNNKMAMIKVASDGRKGLVVESTLVDLMESEKCVTFSVKLTCDDIHNRDCLKAFHGMRLANDTYRSPIKRWASLVEAHADVKRDGRAYDPDVLHRDDVAEEGPDQEDELRATAAEDPERHGRDDDCGGCLEDLNGLAECTKDPTLS